MNVSKKKKQKALLSDLMPDLLFMEFFFSLAKVSQRLLATHRSKSPEFFLNRMKRFIGENDSFQCVLV